MSVIRNTSYLHAIYIQMKLQKTLIRALNNTQNLDQIAERNLELVRRLDPKKSMLRCIASYYRTIVDSA